MSRLPPHSNICSILMTGECDVVFSDFLSVMAINRILHLQLLGRVLSIPAFFASFLAILEGHIAFVNKP